MALLVFFGSHAPYLVNIRQPWPSSLLSTNPHLAAAHKLYSFELSSLVDEVNLGLAAASALLP